jgi:SPP1 family predicted phage head-tail adaptor
MRAGLLRNKITIEQVNNSQAADGQFTESWITFATTWASIQPLRGKELSDAAQMGGRITHKIISRHVQNVTPDMRIVHGTTVYHVESAFLIDNRNITLQIMARQVANQSAITGTNSFVFNNDDSFVFNNDDNFIFNG